MAVTLTEARILRVLAPGGELTVEQIARDARISVRSVRTNAKALKRRGFAVGGIGPRRNVWMLTHSGIRYTTTQRGRAVLDVEVTS
ncbi:hypothetical protein [Nocardia heshunensis]